MICFQKLFAKRDVAQPYEAGEEVLVESKCAKLLWHGRVVAVSQNQGKVNGYRIHYFGWSSRFDEWVRPRRVVEPTENNLQVQVRLCPMSRHICSRDNPNWPSIKEERFQEYSTWRQHGVPKELEGLTAKKFVGAKDRARGRARPVDIFKLASLDQCKSASERMMSLVKAALLLIEASLPEGAVNTSKSGSWRPSYAAQWRKSVVNASGSYTLMACSYILEEAIHPDWMDPHAVHILSCLPQRWKAIREASLPALSLRAYLLDQALNYSMVDKTKYLRGRR